MKSASSLQVSTTSVTDLQDKAMIGLGFWQKFPFSQKSEIREFIYIRIICTSIIVAEISFFLMKATELKRCRVVWGKMNTLKQTVTSKSSRLPSIYTFHLEKLDTYMNL